MFRRIGLGLNPMSVYLLLYLTCIEEENRKLEQKLNQETKSKEDKKED